MNRDKAIALADQRAHDVGKLVAVYAMAGNIYAIGPYRHDNAIIYVATGANRG